MAYEPKTWVCGDTITADALNHIEGGIEANQPMILTFGGTTQEEADDALVNGAKLNATWQEINNAFRAGKRIVVIANPYIEETVSTTLSAEIIGVSGGINGQGIMDTKYSVQLALGQTADAPHMVSLRCDNATDQPKMTNLIG